MSNTIDKIIDKVFNNLEAKSAKELPYSTTKRYITKHSKSEINSKIMDILKNAKYKVIYMTRSIKCMIVFYEDNYYLVYPFDLDCFNFGTLTFTEELRISNGILAMSEDLFIPYDNISFNIYNNILGSTLNSFNFEDLICFFKPYSIVELNELIFKEDIYRITGLILSNNQMYTANILSEITYNNLFLLMNLESSRCISNCIVRCFDSSLFDHCFLEIYRCVEFLFYLQTAIDISVKYNNANLYLLIDLVYDREIIHTERDSLYAIIKNINDSYCIDEFYNYLISNNYVNSSVNKHHTISEHIYDLRCKTAHLRYRHEYITTNYNWNKTIEYFSALIYKIYLSLNDVILNICNNNSDWDSINNIWKK